MPTERQQRIKAAYERALNAQHTPEDMTLLAEAARASEILPAISGYEEDQVHAARLAALQQRLLRQSLER
jgi:hypothetical protein